MVQTGAHDQQQRARSSNTFSDGSGFFFILVKVLSYQKNGQIYVDYDLQKEKLEQRERKEGRFKQKERGRQSMTIELIVHF